MTAWLLITACSLLAFFRGVLATYRFSHDVFYQQSVETIPGRDIDVRIPEGQGTKETTKQLKGLDLIRGVWALRVQSLFLGRRVHMGGYHLNTSETINEMLELLSTVPEKWRSGKL